MDEKLKFEYNKGLTVLVLLAVMTIGEYFIGSVASVWWAPLLAIATLKAFFIIRDYMHIGRLFATDEVQE
jgi:hypothetical protein